MHGALPRSATRWISDGTRVTEEQFEPRAPGAGEVVVEVIGSALGAARGAELAGVVVASGDGAAEWAGRRVVVPRLLPCGECERCRRGRVGHCVTQAARGPVATCVTVPARFLLAVEGLLAPPGVPLWQLAALPDAAATPHGALVRAGVAPGDLVAVLGAGPRARFSARLAAIAGAHVALIVPPSEAAAHAAAASAAVEPSNAAPVVLDEREDAAVLLDRLRALLRERGATAFLLTLLETTGRAGPRRLSIELAARAGGTALLLDGGDGQPVTLDADAVAGGEARIVGAAAAHPDLLPELCALVARGDLTLEHDVIQLPFESASEALARAMAARRDEPAGALPILVREPPAIDTGGSARS